MINKKVSSFRNMDGHGEMGLLSENFDLGLIGRIRDDGYESRSGSDNFEGGSGEEPDAGDNPRPRKKKYHRHTPNQIQELESFFKECPHPDEKQRSELSKRLSLENKQVKFWFQNRRTQMKTQLERHENIILRQENDKLRAENNMIKDAISSPMCNQCGGPAIPGQISFEEHQIRIENARLKDELSRICALTTKFLGRPLSSMAASIPLPSSNNGFGSGFCSMSMGIDGLSFGPMPSMMKPLLSPHPTMLGMSSSNDIQFERSVLIDLALAAMDEFTKMAQADSPLWIKDSSQGNRESLNFDEYVRSFPPCIGPKPGNYVSEATRDTSLVTINSLSHVDTLMDANRWTEMFPCLVARAATVEIISAGMNGTRNGALQVMQAELQVLSPLVPLRAVKFLRYCKQHAEGVWAVVDVSVGMSHDASRRLPSGCLIQDMPDGSSKVIWVEHWEYNESGVHKMFRAFMRAGKGFGSQRWLSTLQRQCESLAATTTHEQIGMELSPNRRGSMVKLAKRMVEDFCGGICASSLRQWDKRSVGNVGEDVRIMTRQSMDDPGEPPGVILSAATSVWVPVSHKRLFEFLSDERFRSDWDILSNDGPMHQMLHIAKGQRMGNHVSLLRASKPGTNNENTMVILQETWSDASGSMVVYAPVDTPSIDVVLNGGDSAYVALLPSGFAILPDAQDHAPPSFVKGEVDVDASSGGGSGPGCLLTVGFQILVSSIPTAKLNIESIETVNNLMSCTIQKIKAALHVAT